MTFSGSRGIPGDLKDRIQRFLWRVSRRRDRIASVIGSGTTNGYILETNNRGYSIHGNIIPTTYIMDI
jgi:hypothetical protein